MKYLIGCVALACAILAVPRYSDRAAADTDTHRQIIQGWVVDNARSGRPDSPMTFFSKSGNHSWRTFRPGRILNLVIYVTRVEGCRAGWARARVYKNNAYFENVEAYLCSTTGTVYFAQPFDDATFEEGDSLSIWLGTSSDWSPITADVRAYIEIET